MGSIVDKFGEDAQTEIVDDYHFKAKVEVEISGVFFGWVIASGGSMRIIGPDNVLNEFRKTIKPYI